MGSLGESRTDGDGEIAHGRHQQPWYAAVINDNKSCRRIASNQMLLNFGRTRSLGGSKHEIGDSRTPSSESSLQRIGGVDLSVRRSGVLHLIDTRVASLNYHYVNPPTRGFSRMPKEPRLAGDPGYVLSPGSLDGAHRSGRATGNQQNPPAAVLLYRRTAHPLGTSPTLHLPQR